MHHLLLMWHSVVTKCSHTQYTIVNSNTLCSEGLFLSHYAFISRQIHQNYLKWIQFIKGSINVPVMNGSLYDGATNGYFVKFEEKALWILSLLVGSKEVYKVMCFRFSLIQIVKLFLLDVLYSALAAAVKNKGPMIGKHNHNEIPFLLVCIYLLIL